MVKKRIWKHPRYKIVLSLLLTVLLWGITAFQALSARSISNEVSEIVRRRIEVSGIPAKIILDGEPVLASEQLPVFYERRGYYPAWIGEDGRLSKAFDMIDIIRKADREGFEPDDYHLEKIESLVKGIQGDIRKMPGLHASKIADIDLLLTDAYLIYAAHLLSGRVNPETIDPEWNARRREADLPATLENAIREGQIGESLRFLLPPQSGYARLRQCLEQYRNLAANGGWPLLPETGKLEPGDTGEKVRLLRERLVIGGDLADPAHRDLDRFDDEVDRAVRRFQGRHGLDVDGVVGPATRRAMNVPVEERITQIKINLERWRWLPQDLGRRFILINIANFNLDVVEDETNVMTMRIVVGRQYRRTPVFSDRMTYLVLCPFWNIPPGIVEKDVIPAVLQDSTYLTKQRIRIFQGWAAEAAEVNPSSVDWSTIRPKNSPFRFRQDSGPNNALGRIKFMFPNKFNVYLHDTPARELFEKTIRTLSSGCIRIEKPIELAEYVLRGDPKWNRERILSEIENWTEQTVRMPEPIPVHILYWTSWVEEGGIVHFRDDIYGRDRLLSRALEKEPPKRLLE